MLKKGYLFLIIGLIIGIFTGILVKYAHNKIAVLLTEVLQDEIGKSSGGVFKTDAIKISLLTLKATARNARIEQNGEIVLNFKTIKASFNISEIKNRIFTLSNLDLIEGYAREVDPRSATFKLIDHLTAPIPPERDTPDRWKIKLMRLNVYNSRFTQKISGTKLIGKGISLTVKRDKYDHFILNPKIEQLLLRSKDKRTGKYQDLKLGKVQSRMYIDDQGIHFNKIRDVLGDSVLNAEVFSNKDKNYLLTGKLNFLADADSLSFPDHVNFQFLGKAEFGGTIDNPSFVGSLKLAKNKKYVHTIYQDAMISLDKLTSNFKFDYNSGNTYVTATDLNATSKATKILMLQPIVWNEDSLTGKLKFELDSLNYGSISMRKVKGELTIGGSIDQILPTIVGKAHFVTAGDFVTRDINFNIEYDPEGFDFSLSHSSERNGKIFAAGKIINEPNLPSRISELNFSLENYNILQLNPRKRIKGGLTVSGNGQLSGVMSFEKLTGDAVLQISSSNFAGETALHGNAKLENGIININVNNGLKSIEANMNLDFNSGQKSKVIFNLNSFKPSEYNPRAQCIEADLKLNYLFDVNNPYQGNGTLNLNTFEFGCGQYLLKLPHQYKLEIINGVMNVPKIILSNAQANISIGGVVNLIEGINVDVNGNLSLASLIGFFPYLDELHGNLTSTLKIGGSFSEPILDGMIFLNRAGFAAEKSNMSASAINGTLSFEKNGNGIINNLKGYLNGGNFSLDGNINFYQAEKSNLSLQMQGIMLEPDRNTNMIFSGKLDLIDAISGNPTIKGKIDIDSAEFRQDIDLLTLIKALTEKVFGTKQSDLSSKLPDIELDITLSAKRNLYVFTNWLGGELKGKLKITGLANNPAITGNLETISGWFGLKDRRFDITNARIEFLPLASQPYIELVAESNINTYTGDTALVLISVNGPINNPIVTLSSDVGLSQREILALVATSGSITQRTISNIASSDFELNQTNLFDEVSSLNIRRLLVGLAKIDSLSITPRYNPQTGLVEPSIIAEKRLTDNISAFAESFVARGVTEGKVGALYTMTPTVNLVLYAESTSTRSDTAIGIDIIKTILSSQKNFIEYEIKGNKTISSDNILSGMRLNSDSRIPIDDLESLETSLLAYLKERGFFQAQADVLCLDKDSFCKKLIFNITEGPRSKISEVELLGDNFDSVYKKKNITSLKGKLATQTQLNNITKKITYALRNNGYISARVYATYRNTTNSSEKSLSVAVYMGKQVSFSFVGNKHFTPEEFLNTIHLFTRKQPFGNNTINILVDNIDTLYRQAGFLYATIKYDKIEDETSNQYIIYINEESPVTVNEVIITGNNSISLAQLKAKIKELSRQDYNAIFFPNFIIDEQLKINEDIIKAIYAGEGFDKVKVRHQIRDTDNPNHANVEYIIDEGTQLISNWLSINNFPDDIEMPLFPRGEYSIKTANDYLSAMIEILKDNGFFDVSYYSDYDQTKKKFDVFLDLGKRTIVRSITIEGNSEIAQSTIEKQLSMIKGAPVNKEQIRETQRKLLQLGLFSRVEIFSTEQAAQSEGLTKHPTEEDYIIRVTEKPLQTLEVGIGENSEYGTHLFAEASDRSLFKDGRSIALRTDLFYKFDTQEVTKGVAGIRYNVPNFMDTGITLTEDLRYQKIDTVTLPFDLDRVSLASYLYNSRSNYTTITTGYTILREDLTNVDPGVILSDLDSGYDTLGFLSGALTYDRRNDPLIPTRGFSFSLDYKLSSEAFLSDANFFASGGKFSYLQPIDILANRFILALNAQAMAAWHFGNTDAIPISQRYFIGGGNSIRGFKENSLGPKDDQGNAIGGDLGTINNLEFRYLVGNDWWLLTFLDVGTTYLMDRSVSANDLRESSGFGIRYISPVGPIGFDVGFPLDRKEGESSARFHFSIGTNF